MRSPTIPTGSPAGGARRARLQDRPHFRGCALAFAACLSLAAPPHAQAGASAAPEPPGAPRADEAIRPFRVQVPDSALADLRRRIAATRWPDRETVPDGSQGVRLATVQELVRYWGTDYDWRRAEARLNAWPQFMTTIDGVDIHFIHVRSKDRKSTTSELQSRQYLVCRLLLEKNKPMTQCIILSSNPPPK